MMAVWLVGPPSSVASATTLVTSRPAVSAGARSSANRTDGSSGIGNAGLRRALDLGDDAITQVLEVGHALGHHTADLHEHLGELFGRRDDRGIDRGALHDALRHGLSQPAVGRKPGGRGQHLGGHAIGQLRSRPQSVRDRLGSCGVVANGLLAVRLGDLGCVRIRLRPGSGPDDGSVADSRHDGGAGQRGGCVHSGPP